VKRLFWASSALIIWTHAGYPAFLWLLARGREPDRWEAPAELPRVSLIIAAHDEAEVIARKIENARGLDYPADRLEIIVSSNASTDGTAEAARAAGADVVIDRAEQGKVGAQDEAVGRASGEVLVFSDANAMLAPDAVRKLLAPLSDPDVGYVCGHVRFEAQGDNQEGLYWRYEVGVRELESRLGSVTAGNGALYATRRDSYIVVDDDRMGHDLSLPFNMVKRGWRAVYEPAAEAFEKTTPSNTDEFARKRRMMRRSWLILVKGGLLSPRGYTPLYALELLSHRLVRYLLPFLHVAALATNLGLRGRLYRAALAVQLAVIGAAAAGARVPRYYALVTASSALGLWDWLTKGTPAGWEKAEGTR
jgi:cellulose synthase/poly-beta-1,6-N-acetylglucosamine synthase-like glycosyltransferase